MTERTWLFLAGGSAVVAAVLLVILSSVTPRAGTIDTSGDPEISYTDPDVLDSRVLSTFEEPTRDYTVLEGQMVIHAIDTHDQAPWDCTLVTDGPVPNEVTFKGCAIPRWIIEEAALRGLEVR